MSELRVSSALPPAASPVTAHTRWSGRVSLGSRIRNARLAVEMTQAELAHGLTSIAYLSRIEASERRPTPALMADLAERLKVDRADLTRGDSPTVVGLRFELAHTDLLLASEQFDAAARAGEDLAEVATHIGSADVASAARIAQATAVAAMGQPRAALRMVRPLARGPMGLQTMIAAARFRLELSDFRGAIADGYAAAARFASGEDLSLSEGADLATTLCSAYRAVGRPRVASHVAGVAVRHMPTDEEMQGDELKPAEAAAAALSYRNFDHAGRQIERAVAALQLAALRTTIELLRGHTFSGYVPPGASPYETGRLVAR